MFHEFAFVPAGRQRECVAARMAHHEQTVRCQHSGQRFIIEQALGEGLGALADVLLAIGRVGDDEIELFAGCRQLRQSGEDILHADAE